jgi:hypothetical protein
MASLNVALPDTVNVALTPAPGVAVVVLCTVLLLPGETVAFWTESGSVSGPVIVK